MNTCLIEQKVEYISQKLKNMPKPETRGVVKEVVREVKVPQECDCPKTENLQPTTPRKFVASTTSEGKPSLREKLDKLVNKWEEDDKADK
ncbi:MAG: hypothetical protein COU51_00030 [Parcubacteria group bacterium CG10_big_fil_rev_8_21_14_0_10_36_14]|nr:MAG: hypothetical protein COU51_00030 [Parcubacteria group bacterium CG10_big_fil_rev_8_21_14_0_10_36_14]